MSEESQTVTTTLIRWSILYKDCETDSNVVNKFHEKFKKLWKQHGSFARTQHNALSFVGFSKQDIWDFQVSKQNWMPTFMHFAWFHWTSHQAQACYILLKHSRVRWRTIYCLFKSGTVSFLTKSTHILLTHYLGMGEKLLKAERYQLRLRISNFNGNLQKIAESNQTLSSWQLIQFRDQRFHMKQMFLIRYEQDFQHPVSTHLIENQELKGKNETKTLIG